MLLAKNYTLKNKSIVTKRCAYFPTGILRTFNISLRNHAYKWSSIKKYFSAQAYKEFHFAYKHSLYLLNVSIISGEQIGLRTKHSFLPHYSLSNTLVFSNHTLSSLLMEYFKILFQKLCLITTLAFWYNRALNKPACRGQVFKLFSSFLYPFKVFPKY